MRRLAAVIALLVGSAASATTIQLRTLPALVAEADQVVQGRVVERRAVAEDNLIFTAYAVDVTDWVKPGPAGRPSRIEIRQPGGTIGDTTMLVEGAAQFAVGDDVLLFTKDYGGEGHQQVANLMQGALPVVHEPGVAGGVARVPSAARAFADEAPTDLASLKSRIRAIAAAQVAP